MTNVLFITAITQNSPSAIIASLCHLADFFFEFFSTRKKAYPPTSKCFQRILKCLPQFQLSLAIPSRIRRRADQTWIFKHLCKIRPKK
eukprot:IDg8133t1